MIGFLDGGGERKDDIPARMNPVHGRASCGSGVVGRAHPSRMHGVLHRLVLAQGRVHPIFAYLEH
jgi:hypothetical protein